MKVSDENRIYRPFSFHKQPRLTGYVDLHEAVNRIGSRRFKERWNLPSQRDLPFFRTKNNFVRFHHTRHTAVRRPLKISDQTKAIYKQTSTRFNSVILKLKNAFESGDLDAFYLDELEPKPVRLQKSTQWTSQIVRLFSTGHIRLKIGKGTPNVYRVVIREGDLSKWLQPDAPKIGKRVVLGDKLAADLIVELQQAAVKHDARLAWGATRKIIQKHIGAVSGALIKRKVFDKLDTSVRQTRQAPRLQDRDRAALEATIGEGLKRVIASRQKAI